MHSAPVGHRATAYAGSILRPAKRTSGAYLHSFHLPDLVLGLEELHTRGPDHARSHRDLGILLDVNLHQVHVAGVFGNHLLENRL
eukprot:scaffold27_cov355-Prasinococcus_capsulatus_cf.AAC.7